MALNTNSWMIRAGHGGFLLDEFIEDGVIAVGWNEIGSLENVIDKEQLKARFREEFPEWTQSKINQCAGQLWRFAREIKEEDNVVTYDTSSREYFTGTVKSGYLFDHSSVFHHFRKIDWDEGSIPRDSLSIDSRNTLGAILTVFGLSNDVYENIRKSHPGYTSPEEMEEMGRLLEEMEEQEAKQALESLKEEAVSRSLEFIKDIVVSLSWEDTERLVAGLLRTMGYKTRLTNRGADLGSDIIASPDVLGLEEPRIKVEVKKRSKDKIGSNDLRNFIGGMRDYNKGIYVTTSGFTKEARYEAERANFPITLIDSDWLVELIVENYEELDAETKAIVPLKRIFWPI